MSAPQITRHLHLTHITPFARVAAIQDSLVRQHLDYKALTPSSSFDSSPPPRPTILTFSPPPVYTTGRRELGTISTATKSRLQEPLPEFRGRRGPDDGYANGTSPEVKETLRGGQITFHGPGQLVIYPILDLKAVKSAKWPRGLTAKCFVNVLEEATLNTLKLFDIKGMRTDNPGVWVSEEEKIAAVGLHLRRNITSFGVGLNVRTDLRYFDRIVACGLEGKRTTSITQVLKERYGMSVEDHLSHLRNNTSTIGNISLIETVLDSLRMINLSKSWVEELRALIWGNEVEMEWARLDGESSEGKILELLDQDSIGQVPKGDEDVVNPG